MIEVGKPAKVIAPGVFNGQIAPVLQIDRSHGKKKPQYQLDVKWKDGQHRPSWFGEDEIEDVEIGSLYYGYEEQSRGLPPMPGPAGQEDEVK